MICGREQCIGSASSLRWWCSLEAAFVAEAQPATPGSDPCEGFDAYRQAHTEAMKTYSEVNERIRPLILGDQVRFRDPMTISAAEWRELAESAEAAQNALRAIQPPPWLADYHQLRIEWMCLESAFAREILKTGSLWRSQPLPRHGLRCMTTRKQRYGVPARRVFPSRACLNSPRRIPMEISATPYEKVTPCPGLRRSSAFRWRAFSRRTRWSTLGAPKLALSLSSRPRP